jgi:hypothetical protein
LQLKSKIATLSPAPAPGALASTIHPSASQLELLQQAPSDSLASEAEQKPGDSQAAGMLCMKTTLLLLEVSMGFIRNCVWPCFELESTQEYNILYM